jgi:DNA-binding beta-propeller fold protein YncE
MASLPITITGKQIQPRLYISTYFALTGQEVFFQLELPQTTSGDLKIKKVNLDPGEDLNFNLDISPNTKLPDNIKYRYKEAGDYFISFTVTYNNNSTRKFELDVPVKVFESWLSFDQNDIRILGENILQLPYSFDELKINPNEFGVADIFNNSILKLNECLEYLKSNARTLNSTCPSLYFGWLGCNNSRKLDGIVWHTQHYRSEFLNSPDFATNTGRNFFRDIRDVAVTDKYIFVLDGRNLRIFNNTNKPSEIGFRNKAEILEAITNPVSFDINEDGTVVYLLDSLQNKIYRLDIDYDLSNTQYETRDPIISLTYTMGSYGKLEQPNSFNNPTQIKYMNGNVYVLDSKNKCVKMYTEDLNWVHTYFTEAFVNNSPISMAIQKDTNIVYILTSNRVYVFDELSDTPYSVLRLPQIQNQNIRQIFFDEAGEFFYVLGTKNIFKFTALGLYVDFMNLPSIGNSQFVYAKSGYGRSLYIATKLCILQVQEVVDIFEIGKGLDIDYWSENQLRVYEDELAQDIAYNRCLFRLSQNIKNFKNSLEGKLILIMEQTPLGRLTYFGLMPINASRRPALHTDVENNNLFVGLNELHVPGVLNREFLKIYESLLSIKRFLDVSEMYLQNNSDGFTNDCNGQFCWSWEAMSTYNASLPIVRICNINPISYRELQADFSSNYMPSKNWNAATSRCCDKVKTPLMS